MDRKHLKQIRCFHFLTSCVEVSSSLANHDTTDIWRKTKVYCCIGMILPVFPLQKQMNQLHTLPYYLL
jgi:hypothetical protein